MDGHVTGEEDFGSGWTAADDADPFAFRDPSGAGAGGLDLGGDPGGLDGSGLGLGLRHEDAEAEAEAAELNGLGTLDGSGDWVEAGENLYGMDPGDVASDTDLDFSGDGVVDGGDVHEAVTGWSHFQSDDHTL